MCTDDSKRFFLFLIIIFFSHTTFAQEDTLKARELSEVVVTGQYKPQSARSSVYQVKVISNEVIRRMSAMKLQDVLNTQLNIRFSQDLATGGSNLSMMGLSGQYVKVLLDGVPINGRQGANNEININQIDMQSIERIEIVEGPMSVVYGADALAGVVNIITKKDKRDKFSITAGAQEETVGKEYGKDKGIHNQYLSVQGNFKKWYATAGVSRNYFSGWQDTLKGRELSWHRKRQFSGFGLLGFKTQKLDVYYRFDGLDELMTNPANYPTPGEPAVDQEYISIRAMQQVQGNYRLNHKVNINALGSYTHFTRQVFSFFQYPNGDVRGISAPGMNNLTEINGYTLRANVTYVINPYITLQPGIDVNGESGEGERIKSGVQNITDLAGYITAEFQPVKKLSIKPGFRFIKNSVYEAPPVIPSIHFKYKHNNNIDIRAAYARGFRAPSIRELYYDFFDASHSIIGNPSLKAEHSNSITASVNMMLVNRKDYKLKTAINGFWNDVEDMINYSTNSTGTLTTYMNIDEFKTRGVSWDNTVYGKNYSATLGMGYTGRYNQYSKQDDDLPGFKWSPEITTRLMYAIPKVGLEANFFYKYTGKLPYYAEMAGSSGVEVNLLETEDYHWADLTLNKSLGKLLSLQAGVRNLFDVTRLSNTFTGGVHTSSSVPLAYGRSWFAGLKFNWSKQ